MKTILYNGYATTGGTCIKDIIRELDNAINFEPEFRLIKEKYGVLDLEYSIYKSLNPENIDLAIRDFIWLANNLAISPKRFKKSGPGYNKYSQGVFLEVTKKYINQLVDYRYEMDWAMYDFNKSAFEQVLDRKLKIIGCKKKKRAYITLKDQNNFLKLTVDYINSILRGILNYYQAGNQNYIGLQNVIPNSIEGVLKTISYFNNDCKIIIVDRDPKDVFIDLPIKAYSRYLSPDGDLENQIIFFLKYFYFIRQDQLKISKLSNVLLLQYENLIYDYDITLDKIYKHLEIDSSNHFNKLKFFNPTVSKKNVGLWKIKSEKNKKINYYFDKHLNKIKNNE